MKTVTSLRERIEKIFVPGEGVVALVDELLNLGGEQGLEINWRDGLCRVGVLRADAHEAIELPLQKSVFRAVLARVAALGNERHPNSVSPYGGDFELTTGNGTSFLVRLAFVNQPGKLWLKINAI